MASNSTLAEPVQAPPGAAPASLTAAQSTLPEFVPLPRAGQVEFYSGLRRSTINLLVLPCAANGQKPPVRSLNMRRPGLTKGKRLVVLEGKFGEQYGLLTYLRKLRDEQTDGDVTHKPANARARK